MHIELTLSEACYLRLSIGNRIDTLNHSLSKYLRYSDSHDDTVAFQSKVSCISDEIRDMRKVHDNLTAIIAQAVAYSRLSNEFDIETIN